MKLTKEDLKYPQIDAAFRYIYDNINIYSKHKDLQDGDIYEFGVGSGASIRKILKYIDHNLYTYNMFPYIFGFDSFEGLPDEQNGVELFSKFTKGSYRFDDVKNLRSATTFIQNVWFKDIKYVSDMGPALLVHIDCDLYSSTIDAFKFLLENKLIVKGTLIAYDEFQSTNDPLAGGESKAHLEFFQPSLRMAGMNCVEVWHNIYRDKDTGQDIRQNLFEVI